MNEVRSGWTLDRLLLLLNMTLTLAAIVFYMGIEHQTIAQQALDIARLERRVEYIEENGTRGTPEKLGDLDRRMTRTEDKIDKIYSILK